MKLSKLPPFSAEEEGHLRVDTENVREQLSRDWIADKPVELKKSLIIEERLRFFATLDTLRVGKTPPISLRKTPFKLEGLSDGEIDHIREILAEIAHFTELSSFMGKQEMTDFSVNNICPREMYVAAQTRHLLVNYDALCTRNKELEAQLAQCKETAETRLSANEYSTRN